MDGKMTKDQAKKVYEMYQRYDEEARAAKKRRDYRKAAEYGAKRDALYQELLEAIEVLKAL